MIRGLLLAAGSGSRMGGPKALLPDPSSGSTYVARAVGALRDGGCDGVTVVVGAAADEVRDLVVDLAPDVDVVDCPDWTEGMGASLRAGLRALAGTDADAALVTLVDLPDVGPSVVRRLLAHEHDRTRLTCSRNGPSGRAIGARAPAAALSRAAYDGVPGHPALIGRAHWEGVAAAAHGDRGAREYYATHPHTLVECGDLATGRDVDTRDDLDPRT